jgi:uracil-DNA glycosylase
MFCEQWQSLLANERQKPYFQSLEQCLSERRSSGALIYPPEENIYQGFELTPFEQVKVVILGQDPYHGAGQAHGLAFSVLPGVKTPPSLVNIYKELANDISGFKVPAHGHLSHWAKQGVLLLNTVLTVEAGKAHSHAKLGWETFTAAVIDKLNQEQQGLVFMLWGSHAIKKGQAIDANKHCLLSSVHPSPLSAYRGFFGCRHFSLANEFLAQQAKAPIDWQLPELNINGQLPLI